MREAATVAAGLLQVDLIGVLVAGWRQYRYIVDAARRTLAAPGSTELVSMVTHQVTVAQHPSVKVLVNGRRAATLQLDLSIVFDVMALLAGISGGRLVALHSGRCDVTVILAVQGTELLARRAHLELPGVVSDGQGIRLLPVGEYPVGAYAGSERPSGPPAASRPSWESAVRVPPPTRPSVLTRHTAGLPGQPLIKPCNNSVPFQGIPVVSPAQFVAQLQQHGHTEPPSPDGQPF